jgi:hypothetical protein
MRDIPFKLRRKSNPEAIKRRSKHFSGGREDGRELDWHKKSKRMDSSLREDDSDFESPWQSPFPAW